MTPRMIQDSLSDGSGITAEAAMLAAGAGESRSADEDEGQKNGVHERVDEEGGPEHTVRNISCAKRQGYCQILWMAA